MSRFVKTLKIDLVSKCRWLGYGIHEFKKKPNQQSQSYRAMVSACKAGEHDLMANSWPRSDDPKDAGPPHIFFIQPVVILDGDLYSAELSRAGVIRVDNIAAATVKLDFQSKEYDRGRYNVDVVQLNDLADYLNTCSRKHEAIFKAMLS